MAHTKNLDGLTNFDKMVFLIGTVNAAILVKRMPGALIRIKKKMVCAKYRYFQYRERYDAMSINLMARTMGIRRGHAIRLRKLGKQFDEARAAKVRQQNLVIM